MSSYWRASTRRAACACFLPSKLSLCSTIINRRAYPALNWRERILRMLRPPPSSVFSMNDDPIFAERASKPAPRDTFQIPADLA